MTSLTIEIPDNSEEVLQEMDADVGILVLVQGTLAGKQPHYAYVSIPPSRYLAFKEAEAKGHYDLAAFGEILAHGEGKNPPPDVQARMEKEHGANHYFEDEVTQWIETLQCLRKDAQSSS